jgi:ABC-type antimicrobial peptide transport system permease subunit
MIKLGYIVKDTFKTLFAKKARTLMTMLGIVIGVSGVIIIVSLGVGAQSLVLSQITKLGSNLVSVLSGSSDETGPPAAMFGVQIETLKKSDADSLESDPRLVHVEGIFAGANGSGSVLWKGESVDTSIAGVTYQYPGVQDIVLEEGRFFTKGEDESNAYVAVVGSSVRDNLFGERNAIGEIVRVNVFSGENTATVSLRIIGVQEEKGASIFFNPDDQILVPLSVVQKQLLGIDHLQFIQLKISNGGHVEESIEIVREVLREEHKIKNIEDEDYSVRNMADALSILTGITDGLRLFLGLMASISLVVGGIGIMNIMLVTVSERTREIGLRKALGARSRDIRMQFLFEAIILTSIGGVIGVAVGSLVSWLISIGAQYAGFDWVFSVPLSAMALAAGVSILVGVVFGLYPAAKAAKLDPIEALRYE